MPKHAMRATTWSRLSGPESTIRLSPAGNVHVEEDSGAANYKIWLSGVILLRKPYCCCKSITVFLWWRCVLHMYGTMLHCSAAFTSSEVRFVALLGIFHATMIAQKMPLYTLRIFKRMCKTSWGQCAREPHSPTHSNS